MNKRKFAFIVFIIVAGISLITYKIISNYKNTYKYEIIDRVSDTTDNVEIESIIKAINNSKYSSIDELKNIQYTAYIVVNCENLQQKNVEDILKESKVLGVNLTFMNIEGKACDMEKLEKMGYTIVPQDKILEEEIKKNGIQSVKLKDGIEVSKLENQSIIIYIENGASLGKEDSNLKKEVKELRSKGYKFKALM